MRIYLQTPVNPDSPPRYYQLLLLEDMLEGWTLIREWGQQGSSGRVKRDHFSSRDEAEQAMMRVRDAQLNRGYRIAFIQGQEQPL
jgi:predicted DNA-binding WGR domain protein